jgi:DNA-binding IscR family transcriptional regulator
MSGPLQELQIIKPVKLSNPEASTKALAELAGDITVADVIQAIEGPVTVTACSTDDGQCEQFSKCNVRDPLYRVRERILAALGECTIAELAADPPAPAPARPAVLHTHI